MPDPDALRDYIARQVGLAVNLGDDWRERQPDLAAAADAQPLVEAAALTPPTPAPLDECGYCEAGGANCRALWPSQRKCCPDCTHAAGVSEPPTVEALAEALPQHRTCSDDIRGHESCIDIARKQWANLRRGT